MVVLSLDAFSMSDAMLGEMYGVLQEILRWKIQIELPTVLPTNLKLIKMQVLVILLRHVSSSPLVLSKLAQKCLFNGQSLQLSSYLARKLLYTS
jgi:hypothetical protein